ncbi:NADAR family protein [Nonomuraea sp. NPDC050310]|uniref:NADAR family protein n=1 Tax=unclassified Nonomuraea TaxID=2593643 RepID=UPI0033F8A300
MSEMELGKTHVDALVTAALAWSEHSVGYDRFQRYEFVDPFPESPTYGQRTALTEATADLAGRALWTPLAVLTAIDCYEYNTPSPDECDDDAEGLAVGEAARGLTTWLRGQALGNLPAQPHRAALWPIEDRDVFLPVQGEEPRPPRHDVFAVLRNEYPAPISYGGQVYPSVVHAYWALAVTDEGLREAIRAAPGPREVKELVSFVHVRDTWQFESAGVLAALMRAKFEQHPDLAERLVSMGVGGPFHAERHADGWLHEPLTPHLTSTLLVVIRGELAARRAGHTFL